MSTLSAFALNKQLFNPTLYTRLRELWFEGLKPGASAPGPENFARWFGAGASDEDKASFDNACRADFQSALESISPTAYPVTPPPSYAAEKEVAKHIAAPLLPEVVGSSQQSAQNALSLFLLLDQMPRNVFRSNQKLIYTHYDYISRALLREVLSAEHRPDLHPSFRLSVSHRMWFYLPFMHSEYIEDHNTLSELLKGVEEDLQKNGDEAALEFFKKNLSFEQQHREIIEKFGRYPHRNVHLGRQSTEEEKKFLDEGGATFGTGS